MVLVHSALSHGRKVMRISLMIGAAVLALAMPALASQCPSSIAALDDQMRQHGSMLSADKAAQVKGLRDKAEKAHAAGDHTGAMDAIQQAHRSEESRVGKGCVSTCRSRWAPY